ncbi:M35 family metallo-endopeptidase [Pelagicoccus sp. SDUM812005]|uniref:M35 family metallo-endopeptidase n=1 Tax=Pelagicoccus sp. SDUM812005 TaxID=3041257 RepID=UPI00280D6E2F|nr:M35 family metallo-endopeptidase [Pelagicoccus sp. SDUM812005]MDQ8180562.1 M35 family metallo-endopeptidase [Pelagicoccus sp. SDUM812005]
MAEKVTAQQEQTFFRPAASSPPAAPENPTTPSTAQRSTGAENELARSSQPPASSPARPQRARARAPLTRSTHPRSRPARSAFRSTNPRSEPDSARGPPAPGASFENKLRSSKSSGTPLPEPVRSPMEASFGADFSKVRLHTDTQADTLSRSINAQAFVHGQDVYFAASRYQPETREGRHLLAHELTHVVQQGQAPARSIDRAAAPPATPRIQRIPTSMEEVREEINDIAEAIPGYSLGTVLIGYNPILGRDVEWSARNFFRGAAGLLPGGTKLYDRLNEGGALDDAFTWIESQISQYDLTWSRVKKLWSLAWDRMGITEGISGNVRIFKNTFSGFFSDVGSFVKAVAAKLVEVLRALAVTAVKALFGENSPAYDMIVMVLGNDPLTGDTVEWSTVVFLRNALLFFGFESHLAKMEETGKLQEAADWLDTQFQILYSAVSGLANGVSEIWNALSLETLASPASILSKTVSTLKTFVGKLLTFVGNVAIKVLELIKAALIALLKPHLNSIPGYPLFTVVLGKDPITGEVVERTPHNFIRGFLSFVPGGLETYQNLKKSGAIDRAYNWLVATVTELGLSPTAIAERFTTLWNSFSIDDLMNPLPAFERVGSALLSFVASVLSLVARVGLKILEFIFVGVMGEGGARVVAALKQGKATFTQIIKDPVAFLGNLIKALGKGFAQFGKNIWKHLKSGLVGWLFGALAGAGLQLPETFDLKGIFSLVTQILGLTYQKIRVKLVKRLGEKPVAGLEKTFDFLKLFLKEGFAGIWQKFLEWMGNLKETVMGAIKEWIVTKIVTIAVQKLATLSNPVGAVIEAIIAIYNMVMFFIERMQQILAVVESVIQSIANIANGKLQDAANYVEQTMARTLPVIISFLARLIGLGGIAAKIKKVIGKIQKKVSKAVDKLLDWIVKKAKALFKKKKKQGKVDADSLTPEQKKKLAREEVETWLDRGKHAAKTILGKLKEVQSKYKLKSASIEFSGGRPRIAYVASPAEYTYFDVVIAEQDNSSAAPPATGTRKFTKIESMNGVPTPFGILQQTYGSKVLRDKFGYTATTLDRPKSVTAEKAEATDSNHRGANTVQTGSGHVGLDEQKVMIKTPKSIYRGGHLISYAFMGESSNIGYNLAPQVNRFNAPTYFNLIEAPAMKASQKVEMSVTLGYDRNSYTVDQQTLKDHGLISEIDLEKPWTVTIPQRIPSTWNATLTSKTDANLPTGGATKTTDTATQGRVVDSEGRVYSTKKKKVVQSADAFSKMAVVDGDRPDEKVQKWRSFKFLIAEGGTVEDDGEIKTGGGKTVSINAQQISYAPPPLKPRPKPQPAPADPPTATNETAQAKGNETSSHLSNTEDLKPTNDMKTRSHLPRSLRRVQRYRNENAFFGNEGPTHEPFFSPSASSEKRQEKGENAFLKSSEEEEAQVKSKGEEEEAIQSKEEEEESVRAKEEEEESVQAKGEEEEAAQPKCDCGGEHKAPEEEESKRPFPGAKGGEAPSAATSKQNTKDCDESKSALIASARSSAKSLAARAVGASTFVKTFGGIDLGTGPSAAEQHYTRWFGEHTPRRAGFVANSFTRIAKALNGKIHFDCGCKKDIYAYVYSGGRRKIYLCKKFWNKAGSSGFDSKPGVIIHELAHEVRTSIGDKGYGTATAESLAKKSPSKAIKNADNYEYYAESL